MHVCTVINKAWLAHARALAGSLHDHEPDAQMSVLVVDSIEGYIDADEEPFEILRPEDIEVEDFAAMSVRYEITALCCALKPSIIAHLLKRDETVVYLDSDVRVYAPFEGLREALAEHPFLLTPHLLAPLPDDGHEPSELAILLAGSFNLGFAAARATPEVALLLSWWSGHLRGTAALIPPARWCSISAGPT